MNEHSYVDHPRQIIVTRLASINAALTFLALTNDKPAAVTVDEMLSLAEHLAQWAWRDLEPHSAVSAPSIALSATPAPAALPPPNQQA